VGSLNTGGGSSAVAASTHAACVRHRSTDPLLTGMSRRKLAEFLGAPDTSAGIPEARWMRAVTFERLVHDRRFVSELLTEAVGACHLERPTGIRRVDAHVDTGATALALADAHRRATDHGEATMITGLAIPFVGMEAESIATPVKPDFAIVAVRPADDDPGQVAGTWLILGDAKDYERVRSRIDDQRMLKGFLQVALGAESASEWTQLPEGMRVHRYGALAVPRNAFLQPEAVVECLDDHRQEVRMRADERTALLTSLNGAAVSERKLSRFVSQHDSTFDPRTCPTCSLFNLCRHELRCSTDPSTVLVEIGVRPEHRSGIEDSLRSGRNAAGIPESVVARVRATRSGLPEPTGQRRFDPVGELGTIDIVLAKADSAALGVHGVGLRRVLGDGAQGTWKIEVFQDPQSPKTRSQVMRLLGQALEAAMADQERLSPGDAGPVHVVVPDSVTADVLVSIADSLAGVETSRLRWKRDQEMGRPALTFNGQPATIPSPLSAPARRAVSFLLEADRARAIALRSPLVDLRAVLDSHIVSGGPAVDAGRLDYLVDWAEAQGPLDHRMVSDSIASNQHTPGARLSNLTSDAIHQAGRGKRSSRRRTKPDPQRYESLVRDELAYKQEVVERAITWLRGLPFSRLRPVYQAIEKDAQEVWRRRLSLRASDLVRFGRTSDVWRNRQVEIIDSDRACAEKLMALGNPQAALDMALDAGHRTVARATVASTNPVRVLVDSRRIGDGSEIVVLHVDGRPVVEEDNITLKILKGSFKFGQMSVGGLSSDENRDMAKGLKWEALITPSVRKGTSLVVADATWFKTFTSSHEIAIERPITDTTNAPARECNEHSYTIDPQGHRWCCRPHEKAEADTADWLADRRSRGELNPQTWPPVFDEDQFDVSSRGARTAADEADGASDNPDPDLTIDDLD
jgi:hypothetical protein